MSLLKDCRKTYRFLVLLVGCTLSVSVYASTGITYHGRILRSNDTPVNSHNVQFRIQVRSPGAENCLLWEENQTKDLSSSNGIFTITIADTNEPTLIANTLPFTLERVFSNRTPFTSLTGCTVGSSYNPNMVDGRSLVVFFRENITDPWEQMPVTKVNYVPMSLNTVQLQGYLPSEFLKIDPASSYTTLTATQVNTLMDIIAGTNSQYLTPSTTFSGDVSGTYNTTSVDKIKGVSVSSTAPTNGQVLKLVGGVWTPAADDNNATPGDASYSAKGIVQIHTDQATSGLYIASGVLAMPNVITAGGPIGDASSVPVITYDQKGRLTAVTTATVDDTTKLPLAGGTMTGSIDMGTQNITNATSISASNASIRNLILNDNDTNTITLKSPADISANYALTMPINDGAAGEVLATDGNGTLSWVSSSAGSVTSVTSANSYLSIANTTSTPVITANVGTAANTLAAGDDSRIVNAVQQAAYAADLAPAGLCTNVQTPYWNTVSDLWACQNIGTVSNATTAVNFSGSLAGDVSGTQGATSVDKIKGKTVSAATATNQIMIYDGTNWVNNIVSGDATLASTGALTLANTVTAGSAGSASAVPTITYDAKGRITGTSSAAYQDATAAQKGIVQIGSNISVSSGTISLSGSNVTTALGYTPVNKAGDTMSGTLGLYATATDPSTAGWDATQKGYTWFNTTSNQVKYWDGTAVQALGISGAGLTSLGGQTGSTQTFAAGSSGNSPAISSAANVHTLNVPLASSGASVTSGTISNTDYVSFTAKLTSPLTTKGDLLTRDSTTHVRLPAGTDGQVLTADSGETSGLKWVTPQNGDITEVVAGAGLTGGATSGSAALDIGAGTGILINADDVAVDVGTTAGKIVQVQTGGKLPALDASNLTGLTASQIPDLDASKITSGTLPISLGGTGQTTANAALNALLPSQATHSGKVLQTDGTNTSWVAGNSGTVTSVTSANSFLSVATATTTPVITANVGTAANTLAAGDDSRITGALQTSVYDADVAPAASCTTTQTSYWNTVSGTWACQNIGTVSNATTAVNFSGSLAGDVSGTQGATSVDKIKGKTVSAATAANQIMIYDGTNWVNNILSGDATLLSTGVLTLKNTGTAGTYYKVTTDAQGRVTSGSNLVSGDITTALGYTPVNKAGDTMSGTLGLYATATDPSTAGWDATQKGYTWFNTTSNQVKYWDGAAVQALGISGAGLTSLGGQTGSTQTFAAGSSGNSPAISSAANVHTLNVPLASAGASVTSGTISNTDYVSFSGKLTSPLTTKGDLLTRDATTHVRLPAGTDGQVLTADSAEASGLKWVTPQNGDITDVVAGAGLTGGANSGSATLDVVAGTGIIVNANDVAVDVGTTAGKIVQVQTGGKLPALDGSDLTNLDAGDIASGTLPIARGGTGQTTANAALNALLPSQATHSGKVLQTDGTNTSWVAASTGTVTSVTSANSYLSIATTTTTPVITANVGTSANTLAAGDDSRITGALQTTAYNADLTPAASCTTSQTTYWNTVSDTWACQNIKVTGAGAFFVDGGNSLGAAATLGTNDNNALNFETNGSNRITVLSTGNIGIGTATPGGLLTVEKSTNASTEMQISTPGVSNNQDVYLSLVTKSNNSWLGQAANKGWMLNARGDAFSNASNQNDFSIHYWDGSTYINPLSIDSLTGNVGIGNFGATSALDVSGAITQRGMAAPAVSPAGQGRIYFDSTSNKYRVSENGGAYSDLVTSVSGSGGFVDGGNTFSAAATLGTNSNHALNFETNGSNRMTILADGKVGIATSAPNSYLHVGPGAGFASSSSKPGGLSTNFSTIAGSSGSVSQVIGINDGSRNTRAEFFVADHATEGSGAFGIWSKYSSAGSQPFVIGVGDTERFRIDTSGNVAIGNTITPTSTLDIAGALTQRGMAAPSVSPLGQGRIYFDSTSNTFKISQNGGAYADILTSASGAGDITDVVAGAGLTGGATSGSATLNVVAGTGIVVNANDVAVDVGTGAGKIVQVQTGGKLPALDGSDLTNLDAGDIATGTLPIARGGTGQTTAVAALNALLPSQATHSGKVLQTDGTNATWVTPAASGVTSVTSANSYLSIANTTTTPVITANVGTAANTLAAGDDSRITGALQTSVYDADVAPAASCTTTQTSYWNTVSGTWACQNINFGAATGFANGGNSYGADATLGTNDNYALSIKTNNTNRMTFLNDGNIAIGDTAASKFIHIKKVLGSSSDGLMLHTTNGAPYWYGPTIYGRSHAGSFATPSSNGDNAMLLTLEAQGYYSANNYYGASAQIRMRSDGAAAWLSNPGKIEFNTSPTGTVTPAIRMVIKATGNIGMGTETPAGRLDVSGNLSASASTTGKNLNFTTFTLTDSGTAASGTAAANHFNVIEAPTLAATNTSVTTTDSATFQIKGAPIKGTNNTITNAVALDVAGGAVGAQTNAYALKVAAPTGATNNYAAVFTSGNVGIGTSTPASKLEVRGELAVKGTLSSGESALNLNYGVPSGVAENGIELYPYLGTASVTTYTGLVLDSPTVSTGSFTNFTGLAIQAGTTGSGNMYGISLSMPSGANRYNIYASSSAQNYFAGNTGIGGSPHGTYKLNVAGDLNLAIGSVMRINGTSICSSAGCTSSSDRRLKENIKPLEGSLEKILRLQGVEYDYKDKAVFTDQHQIGVIAQDVEKVFPEVVKTDDSTGFKAVAYDKLVAPLIEAVKSLYSRLQAVEKHQAVQARKIASENDQLKVRLQYLEIENVKLKEENLKKSEEIEAMNARLDRIEKALNSK